MASSANARQAVLERIEAVRPDHWNKIRKTLPLGDDTYRAEADRFFSRWFGRAGAWTTDQSVDAYFDLLEEMRLLQEAYIRSGFYPNTSFAAVERDFYKDPARMRQHLEALALAQFLWIDQWERFTFFAKWVDGLTSSTHLEIGPGHGLYLDRTVRALGTKGSRITAVDVSPSSLEAVALMVDPGPCFVAADFLKWEPGQRFDSLTMGEVLEHVEEPSAFLTKAKQCLHPGGVLYLSTPVHAPMPDHITAYSDLEAVRSLIRQAGFQISKESICATDGMPVDLAERFRKPIMYSAILQHP